MPACDLDVVDEQPEQLLLLGVVEVVDDGADAGGEPLDAASELVPPCQVRALAGEGVALCEEISLAGGDGGGAALELGHVDQVGLEQVDQPVVLGAGGVEFAVQPGQLGGEQLVVGDRGVHGDSVLSGEQQGRVEQGGVDLGEHELVEGIGTDVALGAAAVLAAGPQRVVVVAVVVPVPGAVAAAHLVAAGAHAAGPAFDQAAQQPGPGLGAARVPLAVVGADLAGGLEDLLADQGRAADRDPLVAGPGHLPGAVPWPAVRDSLGAVVVDAADVSLAAQDPVQGGGAPHGAAAGWRRDLVGVELTADLADGGAGRTLGEDPSHHRGLGLVDLQVCRAAGAAGDAPVAVGRLAGDHLAGSGPVELAPPVPFADLGPLVLGDHALHLSEQLGLRVGVVQAGRVGEPHGHAEAGHLIEDEHLAGVGAGEPVRGQAPHDLEQPGLGRVAQRVQAGPVQPRPGVPVVAVLAGDLVACCGDVRAQCLDLGADRAPLGLALGGNPGVDRRFS